MVLHAHNGKQQLGMVGKQLSNINPSLHQPNPAMFAKGYNAKDQSRNQQGQGAG